MRWVEAQRPSGRRLARSVATQVLRAAIEKSPDVVALQERLGLALVEEGRHREAIAAFRKRLDVEPSAFASWAQLSACHCQIGEPAAALEVCDLAELHGCSTGVAGARGEALEALGRPEAAIPSYRQAFAEAPNDEMVLEALLRCLCRLPEPRTLLEFCEALPQTPRFAAQRRAFLALAFSRLGRADEARALIDPERHVMMFRFEPPEAYGGVERFNMHLADWLTANTGSVATPKPDCVIDYALKHMRPAAMQDLRTFFRQSLETMMGRLPQMGLGQLTPSPATGQLVDAAVFLRNAGRNGEHVHPSAYLSGVYYVRAPEAVSIAADRRGWLSLGSCSRLTNGHRPAWDVRYVKPEPGMLVLFPSHMFHDVVPTQDAQLRISISLDLRAA